MFVSKKKFQELEDRVGENEKHFSNFLQELNTNGVATEINKLNKEVFGNVKKDKSSSERIFASNWRLMESMNGPIEVLGLRDQINAIAEHLKINVNIQKASTKVTPIKKKAGK